MPILPVPLHIRALFLASGLLLASCASTPLTDTPATDRKAGDAPPQAAATATSKAAVAQVAATAPTKELGDPTGTGRIVYFDYDSSAIRPEFRPLLDAHARYLTGHKERKLTIAGHTDERGGREYNLALGQERAESVRRALQLLGVASVQIETVSFGEEKPVLDGRDESAWVKNRRAELAYR
jgi:peptidoglycan-associated lipoprotein